MYVIFDRVTSCVYTGNSNFEPLKESQGFLAMLFVDYADAFIESQKIIRSYSAECLHNTYPDLVVLKVDFLINHIVEGYLKNP